jgi:hypothetical protein
MKKLLVLLVSVFTFECMSFGQVKDTLNNGSDYMTILAEFPQSKLFLVYITESDGKYEVLNMDNLNEKYRFGETIVIIDLLKKYSKQGWIVQNSNMSVNNGITYFYYLLTRKMEKR